jgi:HEXXH motif-containing protein
MELVVVEHARQIVEAFLKRYRSDLVHGVIAVLETWISGPVGFETAWNKEFGDLYASLVGGIKDISEIRRCAAAFALRLHELGYSGDWQMEFGSPVQFCFHRWVLPASNTVRVLAGPEIVRIHTGHDGSTDGVTFQQAESIWQLASGHAAAEATCARTGYVVLTRRSISRPTASRLLSNDVYDFNGRNAAETDGELMLRTWDCAADLIAEFAPVYHPWIGQVTRGLLPVPALQGKLHSASDKFSPGVISVSNQGCSCMLAELLVHEATHQYCYILQRLGPIDNGSDQTLYYSPFRHMDRPIAAIVTAYHAFANILLFYRLARGCGLAAEHPGVNCDERIHEIAEHLGVLETALQKTSALTPIGRALWEPLYECVHGG